MKTLRGFLRQLRTTPLFVDGFDKATDVFSSFNKQPDDDIIICYANYNYEDYSGSATVFYYKKSTKKYYQAYGSHCSCMGLEDQWEGDEELHVEELTFRLKNGRIIGDTIFNDTFKTYQQNTLIS